MSEEIPRSILVSGAAGRIGSAVVKSLLEAGLSVIAIDQNGDGLSRRCGKESDHLLHFEGNALASKDLKACISHGEKIFGPLYGAVHAAYPRTADWGTPFEATQETSLYKNIGDQLGGTILFSREVFERLKRLNRGSIVLISSIQGIRAPKFEHYSGLQMTSPAEYSAIKSGVISFAGWLAKYSKNLGIRVNSVSPGGIDDDQPTVFKERYRNDCLNKGLLDPEDVTGAVRFLLSDDARYISGQNIVVDDGWSL